MKVNYNSVELDIPMTNVDVLEALDGISADIKGFENCKTMQDTIGCIKNVEAKVKTIAENGGADFSALFPKRDYIDYMKFTQAVVEAFNKANFKADFGEVKL